MKHEKPLLLPLAPPNYSTFQGTAVYYNDEILLESVSLRGYFVHLSQLAYDDIVSRKDAVLPKV